MCCVLCTLCAEAQTFTDRIQQKQAGKGTITIEQDKQIDQLVNGRFSDPNAAGMRPDTKPGQPAKEQPKTTQQTTQQTTPHGNTTQQTTPQQQQDDTPAQTTEPDMSKKVMTNGYKTKGYRVQVWAGGNSRVDRQKAEKAGMDIKRNMPGVPVYVHFYSPRWICRIGNYRTYEEAHEALQEVKEIGYKEAIIVKGTITVQY